MSKKAENIISLINKGILPPINQNETFGINTSTLSSANKSEIKKQAYKEFAEKLKQHKRKMKGFDLTEEFWDYAVLVEDIDNLLKEMVREYD